MPSLKSRSLVEHTKAVKEEMRARFPGALPGKRSAISQHTLDTFERALEGGAEEPIQRVLSANPYLIQYVLPQSGHHGVWVFPKAMIKPPAGPDSKGMIPDFLVASRSSLGFYWHVVELKRSDIVFSNKRGNGYSRDGNHAIAQCLKYIDWCSNYIETVRANVNIDELAQPSQAIILIGRASNETPTQQICRRHFDRGNGSIDVVSYDRILEGLRYELDLIKPKQSNAARREA